MELASRRILVNVGFYSEFPKTLPEIKDIVAEGAVGFKLFMGNQTGGLNIDDDQPSKKPSKTVAKLESARRSPRRRQSNASGKRSKA